jgi:hypothetical protein
MRFDEPLPPELTAVLEALGPGSAPGVGGAADVPDGVG